MTSLPAAAAPRRFVAVGTGRLGPLGVTCAVVIAVLAAVAVFAPLIAPHDPNALDLLHTFAGPSPAHPLGTDDTGRDLLSRLIVGSRTSLLGPLLIVLLSVSLAVPLAIASAWRKGPVDATASRFLDLLFKRCCLNAMPRRNFPRLVRLKRFAAPRCVLIFGISLIPWLNHHRGHHGHKVIAF